MRGGRRTYQLTVVCLHRYHGDERIESARARDDRMLGYLQLWDSLIVGASGEGKSPERGRLDAEGCTEEGRYRVAAARATRGLRDGDIPSVTHTRGSMGLGAQSAKWEEILDRKYLFTQVFASIRNV